MNKALKVFENSIKQNCSMSGVYEYFVKDLHLPPYQVSDILRFQVVYSLSSFDRFVHELVRIGIMEIFSEKRLVTEKFKCLQFSSTTLKLLSNHLREEQRPVDEEISIDNRINYEVSEKLGYLSFQDPEKVCDALSYIWGDKHKLKLLANIMSSSNPSQMYDEKLLRQTLKLCVNRRNQIVHEGDIDPVSNNKREVLPEEVKTTTDFVLALGNSIFLAVTQSTCYT